MQVSGVIGRPYDSSENQLPYGGAVDTEGKIVWAITREEHEATMDWIRRAFYENESQK